MCSFRCYAIVYLAAFLAGCTDLPEKSFSPPNDYVPINQIQIASRFVTVEVTRETLGLEVNKCIPSLDADSQSVRDHLQKFPNNDATIGIRHASSSRLFLLHKTTAICLEQSTALLPIFAAEALLETANPIGVPPDVTDGWYKKIALLIATQGVAKVAYVYKNGNAFKVSYWVNTTPPFGLSYSSEFKKSGTWETEIFDARFSHPTMTSFTVTKRSGSEQKNYPLAHRIK